MIVKIRKVVAYKGYFEEFLLSQPRKVQDKVYKIIEAIEILQIVPMQYLRKVGGVKGLYEARVQLGSDIWRIFCFFDGDSLVILLNGFQKKSQKTPHREIERAKRLMHEYYNEKRKENENKGVV